MSEILVNNRDRGEFRIRVYEGIIGKTINEKKHEDSKKIDSFKTGIIPFKYIDKDKNEILANDCVRGDFYLGEIKVSPGTGKWCATKLDSNGFMKEWGYCIDTKYQINSLEKAKEVIEELQDLNRNITYIVGFLKTYIPTLEIRHKILTNPDILELLRNKSVFPDVTRYNLNDKIIVKGKTYILSEDLELGKYWKAEEVLVKKKLIIKPKAKPKEKVFATNRDQEFENIVRAYQGIILENVNRSKRGQNRIEKIKECIYPFKYVNSNKSLVDAKTQCIDKDMYLNGADIGPGGGKWCATEVDDTGLMREWGYCIKDSSGRKIEAEELSIWEKLCNAIQYEQWTNVSNLSKQLLIEGYSEKAIFNTLIQTCNKKFIAPHFEQIKRLVNIEYIKLYPWMLSPSLKPNAKYLKLKDNIDEIVNNKLEYLEKSIGFDLRNGLVSRDDLWLLHYYYIIERIIILSILSETGELDIKLIETIKKTDNLETLNKVIIKLDKNIKSILKGFIESINKSGNANVNFNNRPSELNSEINNDLIIVNYSAFFGSIQKEKRVLYYDKLDIKKNIVEQLVLYNKSFVEPKEIEDVQIEEEIEEKQPEEIIGESEWSNSNRQYYSNYPELNDPQFFIKIQKKKEFKMNKMSSWAEKTLEELCRVDTFELSSQQQWVANFFNPETPYRGLLLYWGTGVGKTCASISIAERHLDFYKKYNKKILIILGTSTLENYKKELYNFKKEQLEIKKGLIPGSLQCTKDRYWIPRDSNDPELLKKRESKILKKIDLDYEFLTYGSLKGLLKRLLLLRGVKLDLGEDKKVLPKTAPVSEGQEIIIDDILFRAELNNKGKLIWKKQEVIDKSREERIRMAISEYFSNRLIIVDEIQNIRTADEGGDQIAPKMLQKIIHYSDETKLVLMSATPMFNNATEITYILNLLLDNDKRDTVEVGELFDSKDNLKNPKLLADISKGYISYVRGANPVSFPRKLMPNNSTIQFIKENNEIYLPRPKLKMNGTPLDEDEAIEYNPVIKVNMSEYQEFIFKKAILGDVGELEENVLEDLGNTTNETFDINGKIISNIVYPTKELITKVDVTTLYGDKGFDRCFNEDKNKYSYNEQNALIRKIPFLDITNLNDYSPKFKQILDNIMNTENGIIFIYSEYRKGGSLPLALTLEQNGFEQVVVEGKFGDIRVKNRLESKLKREVLPQKWKYVLLDGDLEIKKRQQIIDKCNSEENKEGNVIKVIIGTRVASEGVDFSRIRQVHILNPWANFSRIDQVIGRGIRNCSHKDLPLEDRNVTIFLYCSHIEDNSIETTDEKIHRRAEKKDIQMKQVEFILRNNAIDCGSNYIANKYTVEEFGDIGDKNNTRDCGYGNCEEVYQCTNYKDIQKITTTDLDTYNIEVHANREINKYKKVIKELFEISVIYKLKHIKKYVESKISNFEEPIFLVALDKLILDKEKLHDKYHRIGRIVFKDGYYLFQPSELDKTEVLPEYYRSTPLTYKPSKAEIKYKEVDISEAKIQKWKEEIYQIIDEYKSDEYDEISYKLDRVKDSVMKLIILDWFRGVYDPSDIEYQEIHDKIGNYLQQKDILFWDEGSDLPKAIHWNKQISYEYIAGEKELIEHKDGVLYKKPMIVYNFETYPLNSHVIGRLEKVHDGKDDSPFKEMVFKIIDFSFVENKANLKLDGKACMSYTKAPMNKLIENLAIEDIDKSDKRENYCEKIELTLREYDRQQFEDRIWWIESNKFYRLAKLT